MRDKFSELIAKGVAAFKYTPIAKDMPEQDPICRMYNNIFSIPSDTHMSCLEDGRRVITGHMVNTPNWEKFICSTFWGAVNFRTTGFWSLCDFLYKQGLQYNIGALNGEVVCFVKNFEPKGLDAPTKVTTNESNIPQPITVLTTDGDMMHIKECFNCDNNQEVVRKLNESIYIKGCNWVPTQKGIAGVVGDKIYII